MHQKLHLNSTEKFIVDGKHFSEATQRSRGNLYRCGTVAVPEDIFFVKH